MIRSWLYAGAYAYGQRQVQVTLDVEHTPKKSVRRVPQEAWHALIVGHHEGYITWETYPLNQERIVNNRRGVRRKGAPREGLALLSGLVLCGNCGRRMVIRYGKDRQPTRYDCTHTRRKRGTPLCQTFGAQGLERAVEREVLSALDPSRHFSIGLSTSITRHSRPI